MSELAVVKILSAARDICNETDGSTPLIPARKIAERAEVDLSITVDLLQKLSLEGTLYFHRGLAGNPDASFLECPSKSESRVPELHWP